MLDVFITIDTECSMGGAWDIPQNEPVPPERAILGRIGSKHFGTPLIMDMLEQHGLRGTFFIEVLASHVVSPSQIADAYGDIVRRGHDPQLHLHPVYYYYSLFLRGAIGRDQLPPSMDLIGSLPLETQLQLLREGTCLFRRLTGRMPVAYRAGCFGASASTLTALSQLGFSFDTSFNGAFVGSSCLLPPRNSVNAPWKEEGLWEVPITNFETGIWKMRSLKPLDVGAVSLLEMKQVLETAERLGMRSAVILMHSFTLFKKADMQFRGLRPDRLVIRRFRGLCRFLGQNSHRFKVTTFGEMPQFSSAPASIPIPRLGALLPSCRKVLQGVNRITWI